MDPQIAFAVKEEILRNAIKTHNSVLVSGWTGTGKTASALKAGKGLGEVYYYNESGANAKHLFAQYNDAANILQNIGDIGSIKSDQPVIAIIDDFDKMKSESQALIAGALTQASENRKLVLISQVLLDAKDILPKMEAVIRFKRDAAEMMFSKLRDLNSDQ
jgi:superfamily II DNA or RNA helicase